VLWQAPEGQVSNAATFFLCAITFWLVAPVFYALWRALVTARHQYVLSDQRLHEYTGVFFRRIEEIELYRVKDIATERPLLQALFGRGRIKLITSDRTTPTVVLNAVQNPIEVANLIRHSVECCRMAKGVREFSS
jgi:uncharacterized membrane protein YdbT with pleckstrin-like domain